MSEERIHPAAARGFSQAAERYERGRPSYPAAAVALLVEVLDIAAGRRVADLGAGTGKLTRLLVPTGARLVAVEPIAEMRATLAELVPGVEVVDGTAEAIPLPDGWADAIVAGAAFHWFDGSRALPEIHRVLRPGGSLGLVWNVRDESRGWARRLTEILDELAGPAAPRYRFGAWRAPFEMTDLFAPLRTRSFAHEHVVTREGFLDRVLSVSYVAAADPQTQGRVADEVRGLLEADPELAGREVIAIPYRTDLYWTERR